MREYTEDMHQAATYWAPAGNDGFGGVGFDAPEQLDPGVRWEDKAELFRDDKGREVMSSAVVYVPKPLEIRGYLYLGTSGASDPTTVSGAREIRQKHATVDLDAEERLNKVWL